MKLRLIMTLAVLASGCGPSGSAKSAPTPPIPRASTFLATVTSVEPDNPSHPYLKWTVTLTVDKVVSSPSPGAGFWFAIHSPSQDHVRVGNRFKITAVKKGDGYEILSRE